MFICQEEGIHIQSHCTIYLIKTKGFLFNGLVKVSQINSVVSRDCRQVSLKWNSIHWGQISLKISKESISIRVTHLPDYQLFSHSLQICFSLASNSLQIYFKRMRFKFVSNSLHVPLFNIKFASNLVIIVYSSGLFKDQTRTPLITAFKISVLFMLFLHCAKKSNF